MEKATFAAGCFWCTEAIFKRIRGVLSVVSGYTGGTTENPTYASIHNGDTNHAEAVQITFDPQKISYKDLLEIFFHLHNPTTKNRQGADVGSQYRSAIFYHGEKQKKDAEDVKHTIEDKAVWKEPIVTEITPFTTFYNAEEKHQNFYEQNSASPYCLVVIDPKIQKLLEKFRDRVKNEYKIGSFE